MTLKELLALLRKPDAKRAELLTEHKALIEEWGLDDAAIGRIVDKPTAPETGDTGQGGPDTGQGGRNAGDGQQGTGDGDAVPVGATESRSGRSTEAVHVRASTMGTLLIGAAMHTAGLEDRFAEAISRRLPNQFTETQLTEAVNGYRDMRVELEREMLGQNGGVRHVEMTKDVADKKIGFLDNMLDRSYRGTEAYRSLKQAFADITGMAPSYALDSEDFNRLVMRESIGTNGALFDSGARRSTESVQSGTWNLILGDSITRRLVAEYAQPSLQSWRSVVSSIVPINDFRTQRIERLGGYGTLPNVNQGAPYQPLTTPGNEEATYAINKRGGTEDLTLETIANDDLRAVQRIPTKLGLAAAQTLFRFVWGMLIANVTYSPDGTALFSAGHGNTAATVLTRGNLSAARAAMRQQTAYGDAADILSIVPKLLVVNAALEELAFEITHSAVAIPAAAPDGGASNIPNLHASMDAVVVDFFAATSTTNWFLIGDPSMTPTIEVGFYQGRQDPELFVQNDPTVGSVFTADKLTWKIRHIYSGTPLDYRAMYRGNS